MKPIPVLAVLVLACSAVADEPRPAARAMRLPDGAITVDGRDDDWRIASGAAFARYRIVSDGPELLKPQGIERGVNERSVYEGPDDLSMEAWLAADAATFYVLANVRDQALINDAVPDYVFNGDDFEVFIDARPPDARFKPEKTADTPQFIFLPAFVNPDLPAGHPWHDRRLPGTRMASRVRPWGYTIEIAIPKVLLPAWKANPGMESIGFDVMICDADASGVDWNNGHPALKTIRMLLSNGWHAQTPKDLALIEFDRQQPAGSATAKPAPAFDAAGLAGQLAVVREPGKDFDAKRATQGVLDSLPRWDAGRLAELALDAQSAAIRKAGVYVLAKRPELPAPRARLEEMLEPQADAAQPMPDPDLRIEHADAGQPMPDPDLRTYALVALAERHRLPFERLFDAYAHGQHKGLRLTFTWCMGANGDRKAVPKLI
ncbi:MAG TPA: sugar-binding protein, partial [Phycisphaerae bacterium]|nr:sugar-binding protein [Phycisphaerae bacterium]